MITSDAAWNSTQNMAMTNSISLGNTMALVAIIVILCVGVFTVWYAGSTLPRYKRLWAILNRIATVIVCAVVGFVVIGVVLLAYAALSEIFKAVGAFDPMWIVYAIGGFALCAVVGAAVLLLVDRLQANAEAEKLEKEVKQE